MAILSFRSNFPGQGDTVPRITRLWSNDTLATVTAAGYVNKYKQALIIDLMPTDIVAVRASNGTQMYKPVFTGSTITLTTLG